LYDCGWTKEAEAITEVLSGLPTEPVDGTQPEIMAGQLDKIRTGAERIKAILTACLEEQAPDAGGIVLTLTDPKPDPTRVSYSVDCRCVNWYGTIHTFTPTQAACVKVLIEHFRGGIPEVGEDGILTCEWVDTSQKQLVYVFGNGKHSAWGTMIVPGSKKGMFCLAVQRKEK
jgi:hypothetical protein